MPKELASLKILKFSSLEATRMHVPLLIIYRVKEGQSNSGTLDYGIGIFKGYNEFNRPLWYIENIIPEELITLTIVGYAYLPSDL